MDNINRHFAADSSVAGKARLTKLVERLSLVRGSLAMTGLLTYKGRAPLSPLGYAVLMPEFVSSGLGYRRSYSAREPSLIAIHELRLHRPDQATNLAGMIAAAVFFGISLELANHFFLRRSYECTQDPPEWGGPVYVPIITDRISGYINANPDDLFMKEPE